MEGRAIARPNSNVQPSSTNTSSLQWRAGQLPGQTTAVGFGASRREFLQWRAGHLPGQTGSPTVRHPVHLSPSMEGRAIARPNPTRQCVIVSLCQHLQWRAGQLPGQTLGANGAMVVLSDLQWRAGQLPGQTWRDGVGLLATGQPFNGGPGNCPAKPDTAQPFAPRLCPSMEGRAIARPNSTELWLPPTGFRNLQWRAGQLPGQTRPRHRAPPWISRPFNGGPGNCPAKPRQRCDGQNERHQPSMEGRAIARPNIKLWPNTTVLTVLQWRAGQLPGQTTCGAGALTQSDIPSMEGRAIARPNSLVVKEVVDIVAPSMEGRAIARPNLAREPVPNESVTLQWRAGQLPGQTWRCLLGRRSGRPAFNGGPGNCPAKHPVKF